MTDSNKYINQGLEEAALVLEKHGFTLTGARMIRALKRPEQPEPSYEFTRKVTGSPPYYTVTESVKQDPPEPRPLNVACAPYSYAPAPRPEKAAGPTCQVCGDTPCPYKEPPLAPSKLSGEHWDEMEKSVRAYPGLLSSAEEQCILDLRDAILEMEKKK